MKTDALKIMWRNRFSGDTGFVKAVRESKGHFENGTVDEARKFRTEAECHKTIKLLNEIGEGKNNEFIIAGADGTAVQAAKA